MAGQGITRLILTNAASTLNPGFALRHLDDAQRHLNLTDTAHLDRHEVLETGRQAAQAMIRLLTKVGGE